MDLLFCTTKSYNSESEGRKMITKPNAEELLKKVSNRYELVNVVSKRARQIISGNPIKIETKETSVVTISSLEFAQDKYKIINKNYYK